MLAKQKLKLAISLRILSPNKVGCRIGKPMLNSKIEVDERVLKKRKKVRTKIL